MKKFEVDKIYKSDGLEIEIMRRTDKTVWFRFTKPNWIEKDTRVIFRRKIQTYYKEYESINLENHCRAPQITAE